MRETKIIGLKIEDDQIFKTRDNTGRNCFAQHARFELEDGTSVATTITSERKKNLPRRIESEKGFINRGAMAASFLDDGSYFGTVTRCTICQ